MTKHTPGPWQFLEVVGRVEGGATGESVVAFVAGASLKKLGDYPLLEMKANGTLIAAAPELLEALESLTAQVRVLFPRMDATSEVEQIVRQAEAAIRKARGEA